jgi:ABC-type bacteriocin/lantibiotic exporter with double-glycine peptidase domain
MVLAHHGDLRPEADLRSLLDTQPTGTRAGNIMRISGPAFEVYLRASNMAELQKMLAENQPPIVLMQTGVLEYWKADVFHTAVLVGLDTVSAAFNDSYFATAPQTTSLRSFEKAWSQTGQYIAFIRPRQKA